VEVFDPASTRVASGLVLHSRNTDNAENTVILLRSADHRENTSHMIVKHCLYMMALRLRGSVYRTVAYKRVT
jgi:hypothetical protein